MFKAFPSAYLEQTSQSFTPEMLTQAIALLSEWWNKWTSNSEALQRELLCKKQGQLHRIIELCDILMEIGSEANLTFEAMQRPKSQMRPDKAPTPPMSCQLIRHSSTGIAATLQTRARTHQQTLMHVLTATVDVFTLTSGLHEDPAKAFSGAHFHHVDTAELQARAKHTLQRYGVKLSEPPGTPRSPLAVKRPGQHLPPISRYQEPLSSSPNKFTHDCNVQRGKRLVKCVVPKPVSEGPSTPERENEMGSPSGLGTPSPEELRRSRQGKRLLIMRGDVIPKPVTVMDAFTKKVCTDLKDRHNHWSSSKDKILPALRTKTPSPVSPESGKVYVMKK